MRFDSYVVYLNISSRSGLCMRVCVCVCACVCMYMNIRCFSTLLLDQLQQSSAWWILNCTASMPISAALMLGSCPRSTQVRRWFLSVFTDCFICSIKHAYISFVLFIFLFLLLSSSFFLLLPSSIGCWPACPKCSKQQVWVSPNVPNILANINNLTRHRCIVVCFAKGGENLIIFIRWFVSSMHKHFTSSSGASFDL